MKILRLFIIGTVILAAAGLAAAQDSPRPPNPNYDAKLAAKLGADKRGMKNYVLAILKKGPTYDRIKGQKRKSIFDGHFANIGRLAKEGSLLVAGPFDDAEGDWAGLFAGVVIVIVPTVILFVWLSERMISGITLGSVK